MILPAVLYRVSDTLFDQIMKSFQTVSDETGVYLRVEMRTDRYQDAVKALDAHSDILLLITCIDDLKEQESLRALQMGRLAIQHNREHYVIYSAKDNRTMVGMASYCTRPAAIVTDAILGAQGARLIKDIFNDYRSIHKQEDEGVWISVKEKSSIRRVNLDEVCAVTAANKMIEIHTLRDVIVTYDSLENFSGKLDDRFVRCHRSSIINTRLIQRVDFQTMTIHMMSGMEIPLARSFRQTFHGMMAQKDASKKEGEA